MATELLKKLGETTSDDLFADTFPSQRVDVRTIRKQSADSLVIKRGTLMAMSSTDSKLVPLGTTAAEGETLTPDCILCDDTVVGTEDVTATVYASGCFNANRITIVNDHTITAAEKDTLRKYDIILKAADTI